MSPRGAPAPLRASPLRGGRTQACYFRKDLAKHSPCPPKSWSALRSNDEDPQGIHNYSRANISSRKRPPCFLILADVSAGGRSRAPSPPRVRVSLSVVLGQSSLRVAGDANSLIPNDQDAHPSGSRDPCHHDLRAIVLNIQIVNL